MARRRAAVLIGVHVLIVGHIVHWRVCGRTLSPVVLSDSMLALEHGRITAAAILAAAAVLATLIFGRFLCGWACHMGALQDFCAWLLKKAGVRPRMFRSRVLGYIPLGLALYMFVWPTFNRVVLGPLLAEHRPAAIAWIGRAPPIGGVSFELTTDDMWARLPGPVLAVPFLLICGVATVYFLGTRGLCRYGCPYGGVFAPVERLAPGRVVVDLESCDRCGVCTAVCSSGIRVHEEVNAYGRVVSNSCVKTLDCVSACPQGALRFSFTTPGLVKGRPMDEPPAGRYDLGFWEEAGVGGVFLGVLFTVRGLYGTFPLLMSVSIAACCAFVAWKCWRLARDRDVRFGGFQLRRAGRLKWPGAAFACLGGLLVVLAAHSALIRGLQAYGSWLDHRVDVPREAAFTDARPPLPPEMLDAARRGLRAFELAASWRDGGWGLANTHEADIRAAWLALVLAEDARAEALLLRAIERGGASDGLSADAARIMLLRGDRARAAEYLAGVVRAAPGNLQCLDLLCALHAMDGRPDLMEALYRGELPRAGSPRVALRVRLARLLSLTGRPGEAAAELRLAADEAPGEPIVHGELAFALAASGDAEGGLEVLRKLEEERPEAETQCRQWAEEIRAAFTR